MAKCKNHKDQSTTILNLRSGKNPTTMDKQEPAISCNEHVSKAKAKRYEKE
ncbi:hypothetical protein Hdeb2414_s0015g00450331 [Helianthus debilis subsp. tardiflorus]